jgi:hypothetical protein
MSDELSLFNELQTQLNSLAGNRATAIEDKIQSLYSQGLNAAFLGSGWGEHDHQLINNFSKFNRYGTRFVMDNYVRTGYLFMTRPELNLTDTNLTQNRIMSLLRTTDYRTVQFAIRAYLDTRYARTNGFSRVAQCPFLDWRNPFFTLITNNLTDFSGGPTYQIDAHTEVRWFLGESQSFATGSDSYKKPFDLQVGVVDPAGGPIAAAIKFWMLYIELINSGEMILYPDQIDDQILNYTVSFYRFMMDPSFQYIQRWAKYTGCFPISRNGASVFDYNTRDIFAEGCRKFSIGFRCGSGHVDEDDPIVIKEFNTLVERYFPTMKMLRGNGSINENGPTEEAVVNENQLDTRATNAGLIRNYILPEYNYTGIPYITYTPRGPRLDIFRTKAEYADKVTYQVDETTGIMYPVLTEAEATAAEIQQLQSQFDTQESTLITQYQSHVDSATSSSSTTTTGNITFV